MNFTYDSEADALYIYVKRTEVVLQQQLDDGLIVDLDTEGQVTGIEVISPSNGWDAQAVLERYAPSFNIRFADWFLKVAANHHIFDIFREQ